MQTIDLKPAPDHLLTPRLRLEAACAAHAQPFADGLSASMGSLTYVAWGIRPHDVDWARRFCEDDARNTRALRFADALGLQREGVDRVPHPRFAPLAEGDATIETYTVMHDGKGPSGAVLFGRLADGTRFIANPPPDAALWAEMQAQDFLGRRGRVSHDGQPNRFVPG